MTATIVLASITVAGCGGSDSSSDSTTDQQAVSKLTDRIAAVTKSGDASVFCSLYDRAAIEGQFGSVAKCAKAFGPVLKQAVKDGQVNNISVKSTKFKDDTHATVTFNGKVGTLQLVKTDQGWRIAVPETAQAPASTPTQ